MRLQRLLKVPVNVNRIFRFLLLFFQRIHTPGQRMERGDLIIKLM